MLNSICRDETFIYSYNIILEDDTFNNYRVLFSYKLKEENHSTPYHIEQECKKYKEDYPKNILADYLLDDDNLHFYNQRRFELLKDEEWWLNALNKAYEIFDKARILVNDPFKTQYMVKNIYFDDKVTESTIVTIIKRPVDNYSYYLTDIQKKKLEMLSDNIDVYGKENFLKRNFLSNKKISSFVVILSDYFDNTSVFFLNSYYNSLNINRVWCYLRIWYKLLTVSIINEVLTKHYFE
ncbi:MULTISPECIES: hypothetical protein [Proteiniphilum]|jgi:hypothetical protein|uniref:hypothetical protein n=1 Tax=Proteiniphilum TaxID=294702 RepID=UPI001EEC220B|nr:MULTISPECIES: hypothetical protein [Proteiniphilum]ULB35392.1 hypothetical protein KDN43_04965 [Proteiniphilum propionicum]